MNKRHLITIFVVVLFLMAVGSGVYAQTEVPPTTPPEQALLEAALDLIIKAVANATFILPAAGLVVALTGLAKYFLPATVPAGGIALTFQVILWVVWVLALHFGYTNMVESLFAALTTIVTAVAGLVGATYVATRVHEKAAEHDVPLAGYKREDAA
jgi:hypothetical protein